MHDSISKIYNKYVYNRPIFFTFSSYETPWLRKNGFVSKVSVCLSSVVRITLDRIIGLSLEFEYFQTFPSLVCKCKFYHTDSSSIIFALSHQGPKIAFPAQVLKKILFLIDIYKFPGNYFFIRVIFFVYEWKILLKIETFGLQKNYTTYQENVAGKIVHLKKIHKFTLEHFLIGHVVFVLIVKNVIKNEKFYFASNPCEIRTKR